MTQATTTKSDQALSAACSLFTEDKKLVQCIDAYGRRKVMFEPEYGADLKSCEDHLADLANQAHDAGELCKSAGLTALSELAFRLDVQLRSILVKGPRCAKGGLPALVNITDDAVKELDIAEDNDALRVARGEAG